MVATRSFGRRAGNGPRVAPQRAAIQAVAPAAVIPVEHLPPLEMETSGPSIDEELAEWKKARRKNFAIPWRQLSLMASLCFGVASFVLPDSVNGNVDYLLYGLSAASLAASFAKRRAKKGA